VFINSAALIHDTHPSHERVSQNGRHGAQTLARSFVIGADRHDAASVRAVILAAIAEHRSTSDHPVRVGSESRIDAFDRAADLERLEIAVGKRIAERVAVRHDDQDRPRIRVGKVHRVSVRGAPSCVDGVRGVVVGASNRDTHDAPSDPPSFGSSEG
jgi:hypothetical protein